MPFVFEGGTLAPRALCLLNAEGRARGFLRVKLGMCWTLFAYRNEKLQAKWMEYALRPSLVIWTLCSDGRTICRAILDEVRWYGER